MGEVREGRGKVVGGLTLALGLLTLFRLLVFVSAVSSLDSYSKDSYSSPFSRFEYESSLESSSTSLENFEFVLEKFKI